MKTIKKLSLALVLSVLIGSTFNVPKAEAGVLTVIGGIGKNDIAGVASGALITFGGFALVDWVSVNDPWRVVGIVLIVLDAKQPLATDGIEQFIAQKYSFLDDREVISDLANLVRAKILASNGLQTSTTVHIPADEIRAVLANSSVSNAQAEALIADLK